MATSHESLPTAAPWSGVSLRVPLYRLLGECETTFSRCFKCCVTSPQTDPGGIPDSNLEKVCLAPPSRHPIRRPDTEWCVALPVTYPRLRGVKESADVSFLLQRDPFNQDRNILLSSSTQGPSLSTSACSFLPSSHWGLPISAHRSQKPSLPLILGVVLGGPF